MEYTKEKLINEAIKRLETLDEILKDCHESCCNAIAERKTVRYLLYLGCEKNENLK